MTIMPLLVKISFIADIAITLLYVTNYLLGQPSDLLTKMVDLAGEKNLPTWYSSSKLFLVGFMLAIFVYPRFRERETGRWALLLVPIIFFMLSLDEFVSFHEWLGLKFDGLLLSDSRQDSLFFRTGIWMFVLGPVFIVFMLLLGWSAKRYLLERPPILKKFLTGLIVFIGSAAGIEAISNFPIYSDAAKVTEVVFEELGEMVGVTILLWATCDLLYAYNGNLMTSTNLSLFKK